MQNSKPIQLSFSSRFQICYSLVMIAVTAGASYLLYLLMNKSLSGGYLESLRTLYFLDQNLPFYLSIMALLQAFFVLLLTLAIVLLVSHQIAGPVFRYEDILGRISRGEIPDQVATRSTDQLKTTVDSLNELTGNYHRLFASAVELQQQVDCEAASLSSTDRTILRRQINQVRENMGEFNTGELSR